MPARYHAFVSYSHAADGALAPSIQSGLQRFAKRPLQRRALEIFRDDTNLSLAPDLWNDIVAALDQSEYFVFLASAEAAKSKWVRKEIEHWLEHQGRDRLLLIVTDGEIEWDDDAGDFDWQRTDCIPRCLSHVYEAEPLYLDLRWARGKAGLSLDNPGFKQAVAVLAAKLRGVPVQNLIGEEVILLQRARRVRQAFVSSIAILALGALAAAGFAFQQRSAAIRQRDRATSQKLIAEASQIIQQPGAQNGTFDRALLLATQAYRIDPSTDIWGRLLELVRLRARQRTLLRAVTEPGAFQNEVLSVGTSVLSADGKTLALETHTRDPAVLSLWDLGTGPGDPVELLEEVGVFPVPCDGELTDPGHLTAHWIQAERGLVFVHEAFGEYGGNSRACASVYRDGAFGALDAAHRPPPDMLARLLTARRTAIAYRGASTVVALLDDAGILIWTEGVRTLAEIPVEDVTLAIALSADGRRIGVVDAAGMLQVFDTESGLAVGEPLAVGRDAGFLALGVDGRVAVAAGAPGVVGAGPIRVWSDSRGLHEEISSRFEFIGGLSFVDDHTLVIAGQARGLGPPTIEKYDIRPPPTFVAPSLYDAPIADLSPARQAIDAYGLDLSPDGRIRLELEMLEHESVVVSSTITLRGAASGRALAAPFEGAHYAGWYEPLVIPPVPETDGPLQGGAQAAPPAATRMAIGWPGDWTPWGAALAETVCQIVGRDLTRAEWERYLEDRPYESTCLTTASP